MPKKTRKPASTECKPLPITPPITKKRRGGKSVSGTFWHAHASSGERRTKTSLASPRTPTPPPKPWLLIADDDAVTRRIYQQLFHILGYNCEIVASGQEAIAAYRTADSSSNFFDGVLMDIVMESDTAGLEAIRAIRKREETSDRKHTHIACISSNEPDRAQQEAKMSGADTFLSKPIRRQSIEALLTSWFEDETAPQGTMPSSTDQPDRRDSYHAELCQDETSVDLNREDPNRTGTSSPKVPCF